jgi:cobalt-zinc-cadmium efflux system outer membrane protein
MFCKYLIVGISLLISIASFAEPEHDDPLMREATLSVRQILQSTVQRYPDFQMLLAKKMEIDARAKYADSLFPRPPAIGLSNQNDALTSRRNQLEWEVALDLPIWMPQQRDARQKAAQDAANSYEDSKDSLQLLVAGMLRDSLWNINIAENQLALAKQRDDMAQALLRDVQKRVKAGDLPASDILLAQNEALSAKTMLLNAETELKHAQYRYVLLTGQHQMPANFEEALSKNELSDRHPMLREASKKLLLADDEKAMVMIERQDNPRISLNARSQRGPFDNVANDSLGVRVLIPLQSDSQSAPMLAAAEANLAKAQAEMMRLHYMLESAFHEAEHNLNVARATLQISQAQQRNAQESLRLARKAFALGESDLVGLLRVQAMAFEADRQYQQNQIQLLWNIARYNQAAGELP